MASVGSLFAQPFFVAMAKPMKKEDCRNLRRSNFISQYTLTNKKAMQLLVAWLYPFISGMGRTYIGAARAFAFYCNPYL
jgi:hypothetical protein